MRKGPRVRPVMELSADVLEICNKKKPAPGDVRALADIVYDLTLAVQELDAKVFGPVRTPGPPPENPPTRSGPKHSAPAKRKKRPKR